MKKNNLNEMTNGWFIGNFNPSLNKNSLFEVAIKRYSAGTIDKKHFHKLAIEYTVIIEGTVSFNGTIFNKDDIITITQNEQVEFISITDSTICVVKSPSVPNDKYLI